MNRRRFLSFLAAAPVAAPFAAQAAMAAPVRRGFFTGGVAGLSPLKMGGEIVMPRKSCVAEIGIKIDHRVAIDAVEAFNGPICAEYVDGSAAVSVE